jgi:predicted metal-binding protein
MEFKKEGNYMENFETFQKRNPQWSFLVAKIHFNLEQEKKAKQSAFVVSFSDTGSYNTCESCSA